MDYSDIPKRLTLPERQRSLFNIIPAAQMAAREARERIYVIHSPFYVGERVDSQHVFATRPGVQMLYRKREGIPWEINAIVDPHSRDSVFFKFNEDLVLVLKLKVELCGGPNE